MRTVNIPEAVTNIGDETFCECTCLTNVCLSHNLKNIGANAFLGTRIQSIHLPDSINMIGMGAFESSLVTNITLPQVLSQIADRTFKGCSRLKSVVMPRLVLSIGEEAFAGCSALEVAYIPATVRSLGRNAYDGCSSLRRVEIDDLEKWCLMDFKDNPLRYGHVMLIGGEELKVLEIPPIIETIPCRSFVGCGSIQEIVINNALRGVADEAFWGCDNVSKIHVPSIEMWCNINFGEHALPSGWRLYVANDEISKLVIPSDNARVLSVNSHRSIVPFRAPLR